MTLSEAELLLENVGYEVTHKPQRLYVKLNGLFRRAKVEFNDKTKRLEVTNSVALDLLSNNVLMFAGIHMHSNQPSFYSAAFLTIAISGYIQTLLVEIRVCHLRTCLTSTSN